MDWVGVEPTTSANISKRAAAMERKDLLKSHPLRFEMPQGSIVFRSQQINTRLLPISQIWLRYILFLPLLQAKRNPNDDIVPCCPFAVKSPNSVQPSAFQSPCN
jgi:hypothetical protein